MQPDRSGAIDRRRILGSALAMVGLPGPCCSTEPLPTTAYSFSGSTLVIDLKLVPTLARPGGAAKLVDLDRELNLIVVRSGKRRFIALDRACTHGGAPVVYNRRNDTVQCISWGHSEFSLDGKVLGGSAKKPLRSYPVRRTGDRLEIRLEAGA